MDLRTAMNVSDRVGGVSIIYSMIDWLGCNDDVMILINESCLIMTNRAEA